MLVGVGDQVKAGDTIAVLQQDTLKLAVQQAQANLASAQAKLQTVLAGGRPENVASAQAALDMAQTKLNQLQNPSPSDIQAAQTAVDQATATLTSAQAKLAAVRVPFTQADFAAQQAAVDQASANLKSAQANLDQVNSGSLPADIAAQQTAVDAASTALIAAQDKLENWKNGQTTSANGTSNSEVVQAVQAAQDGYNAAVAKLNQLMGGALPNAVQAAVTAVDNAKASLNSATARLNQMKQGPLATDITQAQSTVDTAKTNLTAAQAKLNQLQHPTDNDIQLAKDAVTQSQQALSLAQAPYTAQDVETARAAVQQAQAGVDTANVQLSQATIVAPFDGVITAKLLSAGALVSPSTPIVTLNGSDLDIPVGFPESQLASLQPGLGASITVGAYPAETFTGKVAGIYPAADPKTHTFVAKVVPDNSGGKLRAGMFANVVISGEPQNGALLVPLTAILQVNGKDSVFVVVDGKAELRPVISGAITGQNIQIVSGVKAGEQVVVTGNAGLNNGDAVREQNGSPQSSGRPQSAGGQGTQATPSKPQSQSGQSGQSTGQGQGGTPTKQ
ncbi:MAG: efflux RND transporter periplasmic adaptor subunit [Bacteroidetes bacterium]|nr:efflux RND transporter periplasmic adaptor subunit [Bacteroidota bacterium]